MASTTGTPAPQLAEVAGAARPVEEARGTRPHGGRWLFPKRVALLVLAVTVACGAVVPGELGAVDPWSLWAGPTKLRGANVYQRKVYPELDGTEFMGPGPIGPPYTQADFDRLAALGANYVNLSHTGLFTQKPPYRMDAGARENLDRLLEMAGRAGLFAVISFRTGPGRSDFSVCCLGEDWLEPRYLNDEVWRDPAAQDAWVAMWRATAQRYAGNPVVVGYDLMVEPNSNEVFFDEWDPGRFYADHGGTLYDWNQLYPRIIAAIREVDGVTPILVGGNGYSGVDWLPYLRVVSDPRTVYTIHQYAPHVYTHQEPPLLLSYPGVFDADEDGSAEAVGPSWLDGLLSTVDAFMSEHGVRVAVNEMGVMRWEPGAELFLADEIELLEERGLNYAVWAWEPSWAPWAEEVTDFNFRLGPDPANRRDLPGNALERVLTGAWAGNSARPPRPRAPGRVRIRAVPN